MIGGLCGRTWTTQARFEPASASGGFWSDTRVVGVELASDRKRGEVGGAFSRSSGCATRKGQDAETARGCVPDALPLIVQGERALAGLGRLLTHRTEPSRPISRP